MRIREKWQAARVLGSLVILAAPCDARQQFALRSLPLTDLAPAAVRVLDANGDGIPDLFLGGDGTGNGTPVHFGIGHRPPRFSTVRPRYFPDADTEYPGASAPIADYDGDGRDDLVLHLSAQTAGKPDAEADVILRFKGPGAEIPDFLPLGFSPLGMLDINHDKRPDLLTQNPQHNAIDLMVNVGGEPPSFQRLSDFLVNITPVGATFAADIDHDGDTDLLGFLNGANPPQLYVAENTGAMTLGPSYPVASPHLYNGAELIDVNNDGWPDIVTTDYDNDPKGGLNVRCLVHQGTVPPQFTEVTIGIMWSGDSGGLVWIPIDVDMDGDTDIALSESNSAGLRLYMNSGGLNPTFAPGGLVGNSQVVAGVAVDLDSDSDPDLVLGQVFIDQGGVFLAEYLGDVVNTTTSARFSTLSDAVGAVQPGEALVADPGHFIVSGTLSVAQSNVTLSSNGDVFIPRPSTVTLADGCVLQAAAGEPMVIDGIVAGSVGGGLPAVLQADEIRTGPESHLSDGLTLQPVSGTADIYGSISVASSASMSIDGSAAVLGGRAATAYDIVAQSDHAGVALLGQADFDRDGDPDLLGQRTDSSGKAPPFSLVWLENLGPTGDPAFVQHEIQSADGCAGLGGYFLADLTGDGVAEIVGSHSCGFNQPTTLSIFRAVPGSPATFVELIVDLPEGAFDDTYGAGCNGTADFDADGDLDICLAALSNTGSGDLLVAWLENPGDVSGQWSLRSVGTVVMYPGYGTSLRGIGDLDGNGLPDVVVQAGPQLTLLYNTAAGVQWASVNAGSILGDMRVVADIDADGRADLLTSALPATADLVWARSLGQGLFESRVLFSASAGVVSVVANDIDQDGDLDIVATVENADRMVVIEQLPPSAGGQAQFRTRDIVSDPDGPGPAEAQVRAPGWPVIADFTGDGVLDIACSNFYLDLSQSFGTAGVSLIVRGEPTAVAVDAGAALLVDGRLDLTHAVLTLSAGATVSATDSVHVSPAETLLTGAGTIASPDVWCAGPIRPSDLAGLITIDGDYHQYDDYGSIAPGGTLEINISAPGVGTALHVTGVADLAGTLVVNNLDSAFTPSVGSSFSVLQAGSISGTFGVSYMPNFSAARRFLVPTYSTLARAGAVDVTALSLTDDINLNNGTVASGFNVPTGAVLADLDSDGDLDLAIAVPDPNNPTTANGNVVILRNAGNTGPGDTWAGFTQGSQITIPVGKNPQGIISGKFNADNAVDLAVCNFSDGTVKVLTNANLGNAVLAETQTVAVGTGPISIASGDIRLLGKDDLAVANQSSNTVSVLSNNGSGSFSVTGTLTTDAAPTDICIANFDAGGAPDIGTANRDAGTLTLYYQQPGGTYQPHPTRRLFAGSEPGSIEPGQIDNGKDHSPTSPQDVCVANRGSGTVGIFLNDGSGGFTAQNDFPAGTNPDSLTLGDFDNDGDPDLAVVTTDANSQRVVRVFRNDLTNGNVVFALRADQYAGSLPRLARAGDVDNNGRADVVAVTDLATTELAASGDPFGGIASLGDGTTSATRQSPGSTPRTPQPTATARLSKPPCPADQNGDGQVNTADLTILLGAFGQTVSPGAPGDINASGAVNTADLTLLLGMFGQHCPN